MDKICGKKIDLDNGTILLAEDVLGQGHALQRIIEGLVKYGADIERSQRNVWAKLNELAKVQYGEFDTEKHMLVWDWVEKSCVIRMKDRFNSF